MKLKLVRGVLCILSIYCCSELLADNGVGNHRKNSKKLTVNHSVCYTNPLMNGYITGDVFCMKYNNKFYMYMEGGNDIRVSISTDFVTWTPPVSMFHYSKKMWAPHVHSINGACYLYFAVPNLDQQRTGVANRDIMACKLDGPTTQGAHVPVMLVDDEYTNIDPTVFQEDGQAYLLWKHVPKDNTDTHIMIRKLDSSNPTQFAGAAARRLYRNPSGIANNTEHPDMVKVPYTQSGATKYRYYLFYSNMNGKTDNYRTDYATSDSLTGTFTRQGVVLDKDPSRNIYSVGSAYVIHDGGNNRWFVYRTKKKLVAGETPTFADRQAAVDRLFLTPENGTAKCTPTRDGQSPYCPVPLQ